MVALHAAPSSHSLRTDHILTLFARGELRRHRHLIAALDVPLSEGPAPEDLAALASRVVAAHTRDMAASAALASNSLFAARLGSLLHGLEQHDAGSLTARLVEALAAAADSARRAGPARLFEAVAALCAEPSFGGLDPAEEHELAPVLAAARAEQLALGAKIFTALADDRDLNFEAILAGLLADVEHARGIRAELTRTLTRARPNPHNFASLALAHQA